MSVSSLPVMLCLWLCCLSPANDLLYEHLSSASGAFFSLEFGVVLHLRDTDLSDLVRLNSLLEHSLDGIITVCPAKIRGTFLHHSPNYTPLLIILKSVTSATLLQNEVAADKRK